MDDGSNVSPTKGADGGDLYGWYSTAAADQPDYDPPHNAPCPYCGLPLRADNVLTHSFVPDEIAPDGTDRCYFYRTHRTCDEAATEGEQQSIFGAVIERATKEQGRRP